MTQLSWLLALAPLSSFCILVSFLDNLQANLVLSWKVAWLPSIGLTAGLYLDSLSGLFGLLITLIGTLVIIYAGQYFKGDRSAWRFLTYMLLFMGAMLGLVMAGDVLTLFIFWEATSIISFLLVAYKYNDDIARRGAFKALFITGGGGIALLIGLLFVSHVCGSTSFITILASGDLLRNSTFYPVILGLVALGGFTKSAQFPFHIWLPDAMSAPTP
ncbi:MAG: Na(+)/H(+) antiporter subunit A, partial [Deltaproteobacteria bacterium]|nr:Na(+)/H(+) antiporter subunit A [Deltaproteobacteria bacterium]